MAEDNKGDGISSIYLIYDSGFNEGQEREARALFFLGFPRKRSLHKRVVREQGASLFILFFVYQVLGMYVSSCVKFIIFVGHACPPRSTHGTSSRSGVLCTHTHKRNILVLWCGWKSFRVV